MGPKYINIEISKSAATTGRAQGCFFPAKCTFWIFQICDDYRACSRLFFFSAKIAPLGFSKSAATTGRAQGCFFLPKLHFLDFPSLRRLPGVLKAVFVLPKLHFLDFPSLGAPFWAHMGAIAYCLDGVLGPYWGPYLPIFFTQFRTKIIRVHFSFEFWGPRGPPSGPFLGQYGPFARFGSLNYPPTCKTIMSCMS